MWVSGNIVFTTLGGSIENFTIKLSAGQVVVLQPSQDIGRALACHITDGTGFELHRGYLVLFFLSPQAERK